MRLLPWLWLVACDGGPEPDATDTPGQDTPTPVDTTPADTPPADTPPADTPAVDTVPPDTDGPVDSVETDEPVDTVPPAPPDLGAGFINLTPTLLPTWPRDVANRVPPAEDEPDQTHGLFADLDGDGQNEVVLLGTAAAAGQPRVPWVLRYDPATESLSPDGRLTARLTNQDPLILGLVDLDGDGLLDVLPARSEDPPRRGLPDGSFEPARYQLAYVPGLMGGAVVDLDHDGWADLMRVAGGCRGVPWSVFLRVEEAGWRHEPSVLGPENPSSPYATGVVTLGGADIALGLGLGCDQSAWSPAFFTPTALTADGYPLYTGTDITPPGAAYKLEPFVAGGPLTRRNPMGSAVADLDGDGDLDIAIATVDPRVMIFEDQGGLPLADMTAARDAELPRRADDGSGASFFEIAKPWGIAALDLDRDGAMDLVTHTGFDFSDWLNQVPGWNSTVVFIQRAGVYVDASVEAGLGGEANGRSLTVGDLDGDGRPDLIVGGMGVMPKVLLNRIPGDRPAIGVRLVGTTSPAWPAGATVVFVDDGVVSPLQVVGSVSSPGPLSEAVVFGATGADGVVDLVRVTWPSGLVQEYPSLTAGQTVTLREAPLLELPDGRHAVADGASSLRLHVTPRGPDGAPRAGVVEASVVSGGGTCGLPVPAGDGWDVTVTAPAAPGWSVIEVRIDGAPVGVRPRLWWDAL